MTTVRRACQRRRRSAAPATRTVVVVVLTCRRSARYRRGRDTSVRSHGFRSKPPGRDRSRRLGASGFNAFCLDRHLAQDAVEVLTLGGLVRYVVWFVIDLESRRVHIAGLTRHPHDAWIQQVARNLTDGVDGFLRGKRYLIHDRDPPFTEAFRAILRAAGITCLKLPARSPNLNAFSERFVLSIKSECLDKLVPLGERQLRFAISEFVEHYHLERNHQGLDNRLIAANDNADPAGQITRRERLGGLLSYYYRVAA